MTIESLSPPSELLRYLPAIYQTDEFLGQFLLAFEKILLGRSDGVTLYNDNEDEQRIVNTVGDVDATYYPGLEETIASLATLFDPYDTPADFLSWLSSWTAFSLRADLSEAQQRDFVAESIDLYRWRGTKRNLQRLLELFTVGTPQVIETEAAEFQIGVHSCIGVDTYLGGGQPHFFIVTIALSRYLFSVDARFLDELNIGGEPSEDLCEEFRRQGRPLTDEATVIVEEAGKKWMLTDAIMQYIIQEDKEMLKVYLAPEVPLRQEQIARALIELEKPAHTDYELEIIFPTMQIGLHSTVGVDTLLGNIPDSST